MHLRHRSNGSERTVPLPENHPHASPLGVRRWIIQIGGAAGAGVAAMYFLDPDRGPARRAKIRDQAIHAQREAQATIDKASRDVRNRAIGVGAGVRYRIAGRKVGDPVLVERVRSGLGTVSGHARAIDATVSDGAVRLDGDVPEDEHDDVVRVVSKVPGVRSVDDHLRVHANSAGASAL
jgi:osmotically-inducible protein OsmY